MSMMITYLDKTNRPSPLIDSVLAMMIVWRKKREDYRNLWITVVDNTVLYCVCRTQYRAVLCTMIHTRAHAHVQFLQ